MKRATLSAKREVHICRSGKRDDHIYRSAKRDDHWVRAVRADFFSIYLIPFQVANEEDARLENLKRALYKKKLTLQPVTVGSVFNIQQTYVVINDTWYETKSILEAASSTLKSFFALDCEYPENSKNIWLFIQDSLFKNKIPGEKIVIKVKTFEKQIENDVIGSSK